jgi:hypothetical protein
MIPLRAAAVCLWITGLGFGLPCLPAIRGVLAGHGIPTVFGYPAYGRGPFERHAIPTTVPLLIGFLVVCTLECVAAWYLWSGHKPAAVLALALVPVGAVFWWGFALPFPPLFALARTLLILVSWRALR